VLKLVSYERNLAKYRRTRLLQGEFLIDRKGDFMNIRYFNNPKTLEDLKKQYRELAFIHHPDRGGSNEIMKIINAEYDELFEIVKDIHRIKDGEPYTASQKTSETAEQFKDIITELMRMDNILIEVIGCFIWITGNTKIYREKLRELNFLCHKQKKAWYLKPEDYINRSQRYYDLDEIRAMYGTTGMVESTGTMKLTLKRK